MFRPTIRLSTERMMVCFIAISELFRSCTTGFLLLLLLISLSRFSNISLNSPICDSMFTSDMPVFAGIRSELLPGSVR